jgi:hypothetical protein
MTIKTTDEYYLLMIVDALVTIDLGELGENYDKTYFEGSDSPEISNTKLARKFLRLLLKDVNRSI